MASSSSSDNATYWLVAVPNWAASGKAKANAAVKTERQREEERVLTRRALELQVAKMADVTDFPVPMLRVGTLDKLMALGDELGKVDQSIENVVRKLEKSFLELKGAEEDLAVDGRAPAQYAEHFEWNKAKYPDKAALGELVERLQEDALSCEEELKKRTDKYGEVTTALAAIERKETGTLLVKPLGSVVDENLVIEGEFLTSVFVVVPTARAKDFEATYETIEDAGTGDAGGAGGAGGDEDAGGDARGAREEAAEAADKAEAAEAAMAGMTEEEKAAEREREARRLERSAAVRNVVPRSAKLAARDDEFCVYRLVVFRKGVDTVKNLCRMQRWTVRSYHHDPEAEEDEQDRKATLVSMKNRQHAALRRWLSTTYSEVFSAWVHLKAVRIFVESVLRFGIPVDFQAVVMTPRRGNRTKLRKVLAEFYGWLMGGSGDPAAAEASGMDLSGGTAEFYPYVFVPLDL